MLSRSLLQLRSRVNRQLLWAKICSLIPAILGDSDLSYAKTLAYISPPSPPTILSETLTVLLVATKKVVYLQARALSRHTSKPCRLREGLSGSNPGFDLPQGTLEELVKLWGTKGLPVEQQSAFLAVIEVFRQAFKAEVVPEEAALVRR